MKYRIYRITLNNGDWFEIGASQRHLAVNELIDLHYGGMGLAMFRRTYEPSVKATGVETDTPGPWRSNTYEAE